MGTTQTSERNSRVVHTDDNSGWRLIIRDSSVDGGRVVEMCKTIPYDGVLKRTTETREYVSHRKNSTFNLTVDEVLDRYEEQTGVRVEVSL